MIVDYTEYAPGLVPRTAADTRCRLPVKLRERLLKRRDLNDAIVVDSQDEQAITGLDEILGTNSGLEFVKHRHYEVDEAEIAGHDYFRMLPKGLDWGRDIDFAVDPPMCDVDGCSFGAKRASSITIQTRAAALVDVGEIYGPWNFGMTLVVSDRVKEAMDKEGISGVQWEAAMIAPRIAGAVESRIWIATVQAGASAVADKIAIRGECKNHGVVWDYIVSGQSFDISTRPRVDLWEISALRVGTKNYRLAKGWLVVSRRVLELLLDCAARGLMPVGYFLKKPFVPVPPVVARRLVKEPGKQDTTTYPLFCPGTFSPKL